LGRLSQQTLGRHAALKFAEQSVEVHGNAPGERICFIVADSSQEINQNLGPVLFRW
jgi:hypothetical protein